MVVVAAVDRSDHAKQVVKQGETLAKQFDDELHILHIISRSEFRNLQRENIDRNDEAIDMESIREFAAKQAEKAAEDIEGPYETVGRVGDASSDVVSYAKKHAARYIVIGGRKRSPAGKAVFGSTAQSILLNSESPVISIIKDES
ncbi:universal stress protein [Halalkalicoccus jeotgali]|uniref:UspA domain protein n=1 Tax=Halalkalicoccus jeotgali (strain DSM 18796 / CECT 7217 / JCM 14584 / KCTC 4019 / B3) TaxID=795797 RepID=D8JBW2_HALJB|nr:universal stress protein [Halalkalicoccus jeotgali]ADJ16765.1 uspA domain protein [Halalkalicoccus jeotgali B3]ELY40897.1 uspA domain protein [Halalkalicoccus jeotgali B3]